MTPRDGDTSNQGRTGDLKVQILVWLRMGSAGKPPQEWEDCTPGGSGPPSPLLWSGLGAKRLKESGETVVGWK